MFDEIYSDSQQAVLNDITRRGLPAPPPPPKPGVFSGFGRSVGGSVMQGGALAARGVGMALSVVPTAIDAVVGSDNMSGSSLTDDYFSALDQLTKPAVDYWKPNPDGVGTASQIAGGLARIVLPLAAGGGNPTLVVAGEQVGAYDELVAQGVDPSTANKAATVRGATTAIGMMMPAALVSGRVAAATAGAVANPLVGIGDRAATQFILENANYDKIAAQYQPLDATSIAIDALVGGVAGAAAGKPRVPVSPEQHAAAMALNEAHVADEATLVTAPDPNAKTLATDLQVEAARAVEAGQPVAVAERAPVNPALVETKRTEAESRLREIGIATDREARSWRPTQIGLPDGMIERTSDRLLEKMGSAIDEKIKNSVATDEDLATLSAIRAEQAKRSQGPAAAPEASPTAAGTKEVQAEAPDPVRALVESNPERRIRLEDGTEVSAGELYKQAETEAAQAETDSRGYQAAVTCFIQHGDI